MIRTFIKGSLLALPLVFSSAVHAIGDPQQLVQTTANFVLERLKNDHDRLQKNPDLIYPLVEDLVLPHFDFSKMSQWVLGTNWREATAKQKYNFMVEFRSLLIRTYASALLEYTDQKVIYLPLELEADARIVTVKTEIVQPGGQNIPVNYSMYLKGTEWKVIDISIDGVSLVNNYRNSFANDIRQSGLDPLIARMVEMNSSKENQ